MMKGSTNAQGQGSTGSGPTMTMDPIYGIPFPTGTGTKGSQGGNRGTYGPSIPAMPAYVNYQQTPAYNSNPVPPSDAIRRFMSSGYASGGAAKGNSLEDDIEAAMRIARLIGELTKKM